MLRARRLLAAGALGGHAVALIAVPAFWLTGGSAGGVSALLSALATLAFMGLGQAIQVRMADADPQRTMVAWLFSYVVRVGVPGAVLLLASADPSRLAGMDRAAVAVTTATVVMGWLANEIRTFNRLRLPVFDQTDDTAGDC